MLYYLLFAVFGYLLGSVLFAEVFGRLFKKQDIYSGTRDGNPGTANAFREGGFLCGVLTLTGDVCKGILPVAMCLHYNTCQNELINEIGMSLVILAPVLGHMFPLYSHFKGGKGIAVTFGVMLGYLPVWYPVLVIGIFFILFSAVIIISPDFYKTLLVYFCVLICYFIHAPYFGLRAGFLLITVFVFIRFHISEEEREKFEVKFLWKH